MTIQSIKISNFRNISESEIIFSKGLNLFYGLNGSGKSSLIEALVFVSRVKSFHSHINTNQLINNSLQDSDRAFTLFTTLFDSTLVGIQKILSKPVTIKINKFRSYSAFLLSTYIPLQVITPSNFNLIDCNPSVRRKYIDWTVFHVEHELIHLWKRHNHVISQRNKALKIKLPKDEIIVWDTELINLTIKLSKARSDYVMLINDKLNSILPNFIKNLSLSISYYFGWDNKIKFNEIINSNFDKDFKYGYTTQSINKADLIIKCLPTRNNTDVDTSYLAKSFLSNGHKKIISYLLIIVQLQIFKENSNKIPILLIDDFFSELDHQTSMKILNYIKQQSFQVICTFLPNNLQTIFDDEQFKELNNNKYKWFHVKHGKVKEIDQENLKML